MGLQQAIARTDTWKRMIRRTLQEVNHPVYTAIVPSGHYKKLMSTWQCMLLQGMTYKNYAYLICVV